mgnify:CR=1 FL=1
MNAYQQFARHYIRDMVYAANDGLITTFAVVAGAQGAQLQPIVILALGFANLVADGLAMGVGNYLGIKSERATELAGDYREWPETVHAARHGAVTWLSFVSAGLIPLFPFFLLSTVEASVRASVMLVAAALFAVGALRTAVTGRHWFRSGLEMLLVGALAGGAAYGAGWAVQHFVAGTAPGNP